MRVGVKLEDLTLQLNWVFVAVFILALLRAA